MPQNLVRQLRRLAAGLGVSLIFSGAAQAVLISSVNVTLNAPGGVIGNPAPITLNQVATLASGILAADGGPIGDFMLDGEFITFVGDSVHLQVAAGAQLGNGSYVTGYLGSGPTHATYLLNGLDIAGREIVGLSVTAFDAFASAGFIGLISSANATGAVHLLTPNSLSVDLDTLVFLDRGLGGSHNYADIRIDLISAPVPEPATALLTLAGLGVVLLLRRLARDT